MPKDKETQMSVDHYLQLIDNKLVSAHDGVTPASEAAVYIHSQYRNMIQSSPFPCPGAKAVFAQGTYRFGVFDEMGTEETAEALGESIRSFITARASMGTMFTAFISCYKEPLPMNHEEFAYNLWTMLQKLHGTDISAWDPSFSSDVESPEFAFSFGGLSFFIAGMHSGSPRFARRFAWPTLVFNAHEQFKWLRSEGMFEKFRDRVRRRDVALQGFVNPVSADNGSASEAIQYTGAIKSNTWQCPFKALSKKEE